MVASVKSHKLQLQPVGSGKTRDLPTPDLVNFDHSTWSGDGRVVVYEAETDRNEWNIYWQKIEGGPPVLIRTNGRNGRPILSADGSVIAISDEEAGVSLYRVGDSQPTLLKGTVPNEYGASFSGDGKSLLVIDSSEAGATVFLVDIATGRRQFWRHLDTRRVGSSSTGLVVTPDFKYYAYSSPRYASDLYIVSNLH
jgi:Tol biopolymer transport system component